MRLLIIQWRNFMTGHSVTGSEVIASVPFVCAANKFKVPFLQAIWENSLSRNRLAKFAKLPVEKNWTHQCLFCVCAFCCFFISCGCWSLKPPWVLNSRFLLSTLPSYFPKLQSLIPLFLQLPSHCS